MKNQRQKMKKTLTAAITIVTVILICSSCIEKNNPSSDSSPSPPPTPTSTPVSNISVLNRTISATASTLTFRQDLTETEVDELLCKIPQFSRLQRIDLTDCAMPLDQYKRLYMSCPDIEIVWNFNLYGIPISTRDTLIDFTGVVMDSTDEIEEIIPYLPNLEKIDMSYSGLDDETLDAMNKRYDDVRIVWTMDLCDYYHVRTDDVGFIGTFYYYGYLTAESIQRFQYCEDMICADFGHRITFDDLSVLYKMPQLQYLLLADCFAVDYTPVGSLENLIYLEMIFGKKVVDLSPLLDLKNLKDLNVCFCYRTDPEINYNTFSQMEWLERLYYSYRMIPVDKQDELQKCLPNTQIQVIYDEAQATGRGWRYHKRYYEMRDLLGAWYMGDYGGTQYTMWIDGVEYPIPQEILDKQKTAADIRGRR